MATGGIAVYAWIMEVRILEALRKVGWTISVWKIEGWTVEIGVLL